MAALIMLPIVAILLSTIRVRVFFQPPALNRSAELVVIPDTMENRNWMEKMSQKTPFPVAGSDRAGEHWTDHHLRAERYVRYQPSHELRDVMLPQAKEVFDQHYWLPPLPAAFDSVATSPMPQREKFMPRLRWLTALKPAELPSAWPDYVGPTGVASGARYMIEVDKSGRVINCFAVIRDSDAGEKSLDNWLRRLAFPPSTQALGWIAVEIQWEHNHD